jgi:solute carrier family 50 protein (sugar transporter)
MGTTDVLVNIVCPTLGVVIANMMFLSPWKLVMTARRNRHLGNINPIPFAIMFVSSLGYIVYGSVLSNYYLFFSSIFGVLLSLFYTITCLTIMAKEAVEDEFSELYLQIEWIIFGGIAFWATIGIVQTSLFHSFPDSHEQAATMVGYICCFFSICYYAAPLSAMAEIISKKDSSSLYLPNIFVNCINTILWMSYGAFGVNNAVIWVPSFIGLILSLIQVFLVFRYHKGDWFEAISGWITHRTIQVKTRVADEYEDGQFTVEVGDRRFSSSGDNSSPVNVVRRMSFCVVPADQMESGGTPLLTPRSRHTKSRAGSVV